MSDLISRSAVIKALEECNLDKQLFEKDVFEKINAIPTAYDVEKVVDDIESEKIVYQGLRTETTDTIDIDEAIEIVRKGGV